MEKIHKLKWKEFEVNGNKIVNGIWMYARGRGSPGTIGFDLRNNFHGVRGTAVVLRERRSPVTFRVVGDGNVLWTSTPLQGKESFQIFEVAVSGIHKLELLIDSPESSVEAAWVDPILTR